MSSPDLGETPTVKRDLNIVRHSVANELGRRQQAQVCSLSPLSYTLENRSSGDGPDEGGYWLDETGYVSNLGYLADESQILVQSEP